MPFRWRRLWVLIICTVVLYWSGSSLYRRVMFAWYLSHNVPGFVAYGAHEDLFSPDNRFLAIAFGNRCKIIDLTNGGELARLEDYRAQGLADYSSDGKIISRFQKDPSGNQIAYLWSASSGRMLGEIEAPKGVDLEASGPVFSPDGDRVVVATDRGLVVWDAQGLMQIGNITISLPKNTWLPRLLAWNPTSSQLTAVNDAGLLFKVDLDQVTAIPWMVEQPKAVKSAQWSPDGKRLLTINSDDGSVSVWDLKAGKVVVSIPENDTLNASFSPDSMKILTAKRRKDVIRTGRWAPSLWDRSTKLWSATTGELIRELPTTGIVTFSPDWTFRVETGPKGLRVARSDDSETCFFPEWFDGHGSSCVFALDNSHLASVNGSGRVAIWRYRAASLRGIDFLNGLDFWITVIALIVLLWTVYGIRSKIIDDTRLT